MQTPNIEKVWFGLQNAYIKQNIITRIKHQIMKKLGLILQAAQSFHIQ